MRSIKDLKRASIYLIDKVYRIVPYTLSNQGVPTAELSIIFLDQSADVYQLGEEVLYALHKNKSIVSHPQTSQEWKDSDQEFDKAMKVKSWKYVVKHAKKISANITGNKIQLSSSKPLKGGFGPSGKPDRFCPDVDPEALGQAIIDTFADCE